MSKMISTTLYVTPRQIELLHRLSEATKVPFASFIREGIDMEIEAEQERIANGTALVRR